MTRVTAGIMDQLREGTRALHDAAEGHEFQRLMFAGRLPREAYAAYLGQMACAYGALEHALSEARSVEARIAAVVQPHHLRTEDLQEDLEHFAVKTAEIKPNEATQELINRIKAVAQDRPLALLGMHYVLEGSNNGNHFIAKNIRKAYGLTEAGTRFLDPYGDAQRQRWAEYKQAMSELDLTADECDTMLAAAQDMFRAIGQISEALHRDAVN
jgi:heme oxygenase